MNISSKFSLKDLTANMMTRAITKQETSILSTIGNTPLIRLRSVVQDIPAKVYAKVEAFNPGNSAKDRIAFYMIEKAEMEGKIKKGDTIVEATSGNTGYSLAMICALKGYKCLLTVSDKASDAKIALLKGMGAEVVLCPKDAKPEDPNSYYSMATKFCKERPNTFYLNQNYSLANSEAHYHSTGPEIWKQTNHEVTHYVACSGTGGTLCGTGQYLKEQNPDVQIIGVDAYGSVLKKYYDTGEFDENEISSYRVEGLGKTIIPANFNPEVIDQMIKVTDKDSAFKARALANQEGLLVGYSSGSTLQAVYELKDQLTEDDVVVILCSDHGSRYLDKIYCDEWMRQQGFMD